jgi:hypothetical protein
MTEMLQSSSVQAIRREEHSTLQDLSAELLRLAESKADFIVDTRRMSFASESLGVGHVLTEGGSQETRQESYLTFDSDRHDDIGGGPVNEYAHGQIRTRLGIPAKYYDRMRSDAPALLDTNVNHWFHNAPETRMVRMQEGRVRAFLSNRYRRLDNDELLAHAVVPVFAEYGDRLVFHISALTDKRLYIRAILPELQDDITLDPRNHVIRRDDGGDVVQAGIEIRNSEVGAGALSVTPFIWRLKCLNGLVMSDRSLRRYHIGREQEETAYEIFRDDTLAADDRAFYLKVRDAVAAALSDVTFGQIVQQLRAAATGATILDLPLATERLAKRIDLSEDESSSVLRYLAMGGDLTQWGAVNAITRAAKDAEGFDRQAEMETLGAAVVAMPAQEWAQIAR